MITFTHDMYERDQEGTVTRANVLTDMKQVGMRSEGLCDSLFVLSGMTIRLAQTMGLHRDGKALGLSPFETELRRRLWWHIVHLDFRAADMYARSLILLFRSHDP